MKSYPAESRYDKPVTTPPSRPASTPTGHGLTFAYPVPGGVRTAAGWRWRWSGVAVMGILNVTPDSFSDGGRYLAPERAAAHAQALIAAGAAVLDVGAESTRPGAEPVPAEVELDRLLPVLARLKGAPVPLSVDTYKPEVAAAALAAGAHLVNDVSGLRDPEMVRVCAAAGAPAVVMHMQGTPKTMQDAPHYEDVVGEVRGFLQARAAAALEAGVPSVLLDPGIGFGKTLAHNLALLRNLRAFTALGHPVLLGASRKGIVRLLTGAEAPEARDAGSLALHLWGVQQGVSMVRVHEVAAHVSALKAWAALADEGAVGET
ncbi:dihydropteroate synthase [Truepera radiovictrix]|uniref:Dihydropteroate synthase n=1 Tax=Truepera radiovictrix (strain DSM 17093 / CIP 108686 / LMG 22925 / RQ-24) TaxID=649638 RepID=D7CXI3_TRURR|nr:dihydropteroate synthase [Truepera radiovictrix DSM 17093]